MRLASNLEAVVGAGEFAALGPQLDETQEFGWRPPTRSYKNDDEPPDAVTTAGSDRKNVRPERAAFGSSLTLHGFTASMPMKRTINAMSHVGTARSKPTHHLSTRSRRLVVSRRVLAKKSHHDGPDPSANACALSQSPIGDNQSHSAVRT